jgi:hypothetical protein
MTFPTASRPDPPVFAQSAARIFRDDDLKRVDMPR